MVKATVNFRLDADIKAKMEEALSEMGMTPTAAYTVFATAVARQRRIPFEISADPFWSEANQAYLEKVITGIESGDVPLAHHNLIEAD